MMRDEKGFDLWANDYDKCVNISFDENTYPFAGYKKVLGDIYETIMKVPNAKVLDIGFGTATLTTKLYEAGCEIYGQDFSSNMIEIALKKMPNASLYKYDFTIGLAPELKNQKFDFIVATYSLHHIKDNQKATFLKNLQNLLNENGMILIGDVAFETRAHLEQCKKESGDDWDNDEQYLVFDELKAELPSLSFNKISYCAGIFTLKA